jgi:hypothetical protein
MIVLKEVSRYKLYLAGAQEVRWDCFITEPAVEHTFCYGKGNENHDTGTGFMFIRESHRQLRDMSLLQYQEVAGIISLL